MPRPTVLVATTNLLMAYALRESLADPCRRLGLRLDVCPGGDNKDKDLHVHAYYSAEALFDRLAVSDPMSLADTLVVLDVGAGLVDAFQPAGTSGDHGWHITKQRRAGVAVELILRFPQVFPVVVSLAVPIGEIPPQDEVQFPVFARTAPNKWSSFREFRKLLCTRDCNGLKRDLISNAAMLVAHHVPLHFVSPLDGGRGLYSTLARFARGMRCWFDPTGLRTLVKNRFLGTLFGSNDDWNNTWEDQREVLLSRLHNAAVAVDEEREFALLNAYAAWKYGRRAWLVTSYAEFQEHPLWTWDYEQRKVGSEATGVTKRPPAVSQEAPEEGVTDVIVLRDVDMRFPDVPDSKGVRKALKDIESNEWKQKIGPEWHVRAISGEARIDQMGQPLYGWCGEQWRLGQRKAVSGENDTIEYLGFQKPVDSIYELKKILGLRAQQAEVTILSRIIAVKDQKVGNDDGGKGHGAPYLNLAMAESLLQQSRHCEGGPAANLLGALLAGESYELLLGMSKTTALEALLAIHKKEVAAEVEFPGVAHAIDIKPRRADVKATLEKLCKVQTSDRGTNTPPQAMQDMFLSQFWAELKQVYSNGGQFAAAEAANARSLIHGEPFKPGLFNALNTVWRCTKILLVPLTTSFPCLVVASLFTNAIATAFYACVARQQIDLELFISALFSSITLQPMLRVSKIVEGCGMWGQIVGIGHIGVSYLLFGLLISMLYRKVTRG